MAATAQGDRSFGMNQDYPIPHTKLDESLVKSHTHEGIAHNNDLKNPKHNRQMVKVRGSHKSHWVKGAQEVHTSEGMVLQQTRVPPGRVVSWRYRAPHTTRKSYKSQQTDRHKKHGSSNLGPKKGGAGGHFTWGAPGSELNDYTHWPAEYHFEQDPGFDPDEEEYWEEFQYEPGKIDWSHAPASVHQTRLTEHLELHDQFKHSIQGALNEWFDSQDTKEFASSIRGLNVSDWHGDLVYYLLKFSLARSDANRSQLMSLLQQLNGQNLVDKQQFEWGFAKGVNALDDWSLDIPNARELLLNLAGQAASQGWLSSERVDSMRKQVESVPHSMPHSDQRAAADSLVADFLSSENFDAAVEGIEKLGDSHHHHRIVRELVVQAMTKGSNSQRENVAELLKEAHWVALNPAEIIKGFRVLIERAEEWTAKESEAPRLLAVFLARALLDRILPADFINTLSLPSHSLGSRVLSLTQWLLEQPRSEDLIYGAWMTQSKDVNEGLDKALPGGNVIEIGKKQADGAAQGMAAGAFGGATEQGLSKAAGSRATGRT